MDRPPRPIPVRERLNTPRSAKRFFRGLSVPVNLRSRRRRMEFLGYMTRWRVREYRGAVYTITTERTRTYLRVFPSYVRRRTFYVTRYTFWRFVWSCSRTIGRNENDEANEGYP